MNPPISWVGGKRRLLPEILIRFPVAFDSYIEVFGGSGAVLFGKKPTPYEVWNDFNGDLFNMFYCIKYKHLAFLQELRFLPLNSRDEFNLMLRFINGEEFALQDMQEELVLAQVYFDEPDAKMLAEILTRRCTLGDVSRASAFYKLNRYSYGSGMKSFGCQPCDIRKTYILIWEAHRRLSGTVHLEHKDFEALTRQYDGPNAFFYYDPPYYNSEKPYAVHFPREDHYRLRDLAGSMKGKFMISYGDVPEIRQLYKGFEIVEFKRINNLAQRYNPGCEYPELLIANYDMSERGRLYEQICLPNFA